jgi:Putative peptidoglycan binding domain
MVRHRVTQQKREKLPEALARSRNDSVLSRPARNASREGREGLVWAAIRPLLSRPSRTIAGATLAAVLTGIVVNALLMQKERHSAPFFSFARPAPVAVEPPPRPTPTVAESAPTVAPPAARVAEPAAILPVVPVPVPAPRSGDSIRDLLRGDAAKDPGHLTVVAQNALIKLGFSIKADGVVGASTEQAIQQFEHAHGLASSSEITPKLVKQLSAAANVGGR